MRRVAITGIGLITPLGIGIEDNWNALLAKKSGIGPITQFDASAFSTTIAGEVKDFDANKWLDRRLTKTIDRFLQFSTVAGQMAMEDAGLPMELEGEESERAGCYVGAGLGGVISIESTYLKYQEKGPRHGFSPYFVPGIIVNLAPGQLSIRHKLKGPNISHVSACSTSAHSLGEAMWAIQRGTCDMVVAGGTEASVSVLGLGGFTAARALSTRNDDPEHASRPFDADRDGFVMSEGAGIVILEEMEKAKKRGARIYAELSGYGATADAHHITMPAPGGEGAQRCMRLALADAKIDASDVGYINAHGTSTKFNDATETAAVKAAFGDHAKKLAMSSTKSMTGHLLGAAGGVEAAFTALALHRSVLPPTANYQTPDPECDLDYVTEGPREKRVDHALSNSFGFGGTNVALVFSRADR